MGDGKKGLVFFFQSPVSSLHQLPAGSVSISQRLTPLLGLFDSACGNRLEKDRSAS
jgi:hypothetical protein